jgi:hypothetical protein
MAAAYPRDVGVNLSNLPPAMQAKVLAQAGEKPRARKSRAGTGDGQPCPGRCSCGATFMTYRRWEQKHFGPGHSRWSVDI